MSAKVTDVVLSIALGIWVVYAAHGFLVTDVCLDMGGVIDPETGECLDENYHEQYIVLSPILIVVYFIMGSFVSIASVFTIKFIRRTKGG